MQNDTKSEAAESRFEAKRARELTDQIKANADELWRLMLQAYEGGAHTALGYSSWGDYFETEFGGGKSQAYRVLDAGRVARALEDDSPIGERDDDSSVGKQLNEAQARALSPLVKEDPALARRVAEEVNAEHGQSAAAKHYDKAVKEVFEATAIREQLPPRTRAVVEESNPDDCSLSRSPAQLRHLQNIAAKRGDERGAETAERVANGEHRSTFDAYPEVKAEAAPKPLDASVGEILERGKVSISDRPQRTEEEKAFHDVHAALLVITESLTISMASVAPSTRERVDFLRDAEGARDRLTTLLHDAGEQGHRPLRLVGEE